MTNTNVEMFLLITGKAMIRAAESNDAELQHEVIKNFLDVAKDWEQKALNTVYLKMLENRES
jgi:hypothetical protein